MRHLLYSALMVSFLLVGGTTPLEAAPPNCVNVHFHPNSLPAGQVGNAYTQVVWITPASALLYKFDPLPPSAPPGLSLVSGPNANQATILGFPTQAGTYTFTVSGGGIFVWGTICWVSKTYTVTIAP